MILIVAIDVDVALAALTALSDKHFFMRRHFVAICGVS